MLRDSAGIMANPALYLRRMAGRHGDVVQFPVPHPTYLVTSWEHTRTVLVSQHRCADKDTPQYHSLAALTGPGLLAAEQDAWMQQRPKVQPAFARTSLAPLAAIAAEESRAWAGEWADRGFVDIGPAADRYSLRVLSRFLFGVVDSQRVEDVLAATRAGLEGVLNRVRFAPAPANGTDWRPRLDAAVARLLDGAGDTPFVACLRGMSDPEEVYSQVRTFLIAGHETVASALIWSLALLGAAPHRQAELLEQSPTASPSAALHNDRWRRTVNESLRLFPPAWLITRRTRSSMRLGQFLLPAGALVILSPFVVQRDARLWGRPDHFDPGRPEWERGQPPGYLPFGSGPRLCIGREFSMVVATAALSELAHRLSWQLLGTPGLRAGVVLRPRRRVTLRIRHR